MGRFRPSGSKNHSIQRIMRDCYRLSWTVDRYYTSSRLRHPTRYSRTADETGAKRFAKRWGIEMPAPSPRTDGGGE